MDVNTTPSATSAALTPPKTHSPNKWLANHENLAKRVKTYASPAPAPISDTLREAVLSQTDSESVAQHALPTVPQFDFSPIDTSQHDLAHAAVSLSHTEQGSSLNELIQGNFGSGAGSLIKSSLPEQSNPLTGPPTRKAADISDTVAPFQHSNPQHENETAYTLAASTADDAEQQDSVGTSVASDVTVPNTFDSLFKDNLEYRMPEDTMRAGLLTATQTVSLEGPDKDLEKSVSFEASTSKTSPKESEEPITAPPIPEVEQNAIPATSQARVPSLNHDPATLPATNEDRASTTTLGDSNIELSDQAVRVNDEALKMTSSTTSNQTPITALQQASDLVVASEEVGAEQGTSLDDPSVEVSNATNKVPSTPVRSRSKKTPKTAPRPARSNKTPPPKSTSRVPMTEPRRSRKDTKLVQLIAEEAENVESIPATEESQKTETKVSNSDEMRTSSVDASLALVDPSDTFKTPGKTTSTHGSPGLTTTDNPEGVLSSPTRPGSQTQTPRNKEGEITSTTRASRKNDILSTPHSQELQSAKKSIRRSSQRITDAPVATPQPTPTKSAAKATKDKADAHLTDNGSADPIASTAPRSSRSRKSDAPASVPKGSTSKSDIGSSPIRRTSRNLGVDQPRKLTAELQKVPEMSARSSPKLASSPLQSRRSKNKKAVDATEESPNNDEDAATRSTSGDDKKTSKRKHARTESKDSTSSMANKVNSTELSSSRRKTKKQKADDNETPDIVPKRSSRAKETVPKEAAAPIGGKKSGRSKAGAEHNESTTIDQGSDDAPDQVEKTKRTRRTNATKENDDAAEVAQKPTETRSRRSKRVASPASPKAVPIRGSKRKAEDEGQEEKQDKEEEGEEKKVSVSKAGPVAKKTRASQAQPAAVPEPKKTTRASKDKAKNAVIASPKTTRGSARVSTRSTRSKK